jgi:hypothetical protein
LTPEAKVKKKVKEFLIANKFWFCTPATGGYGRSGVPDFIACKDGLFFAIECKANGNKPTVLQQSEIDGIQAAGGMAVVIDEKNVADLNQIILRSNLK